MTNNLKRPLYRRYFHFHHPFLSYVIFGNFKESDIKQFVKKNPFSFDIKIFEGEDPVRTKFMDIISFEKDRLALAGAPDTSGMLPERCKMAESCIVVQGTDIKKCRTLHYLKNAVEIVQAFVDLGAAAVFDPQTLTIYSPEKWTETFVGKPVNEYDHVRVCTMKYEDGLTGFYTMGMWKFGDYDIMVNALPDEKLDTHYSDFIGCVFRTSRAENGRGITGYYETRETVNDKDSIEAKGIPDRYIDYAKNLIRAELNEIKRGRDSVGRVSFMYGRYYIIGTVVDFYEDKMLSKAYIDIDHQSDNRDIYKSYNGYFIDFDELIIKGTPYEKWHKYRSNVSSCNRDINEDKYRRRPFLWMLNGLIPLLCSFIDWSKIDSLSSPMPPIHMLLMLLAILFMLKGMSYMSQYAQLGFFPDTQDIAYDDPYDIFIWQSHKIFCLPVKDPKFSITYIPPLNRHPLYKRDPSSWMEFPINDMKKFEEETQYLLLLELNNRAYEKGSYLSGQELEDAVNTVRNIDPF